MELGAGTYLAKRGAQKALSKLPGLFFNPILKRLAPFDPKRIKVELENIPSITLNRSASIYNFHVHIDLENLSNYEVEIFSSECRSQVSSSILHTLHNNKMFVIKPGKTASIFFEKELTEGEVTRTEKIFEEQDIKIARLEFLFSARNQFGPTELHLVKNATCIMLVKF